MPRTSAGLLLYRRHPERGVEVLVGHMGGPFWARKDAGAWSIPKGEHGADEEPRDVALREFAEEMGTPAPVTDLVPLGEVRQSGGKRLTAWAAEGTSTRRPRSATPSPSSGRRARAACRSSPRSTAPRGCPSTRPGRSW
jgi:predicted NUDIX family NTP pyrophosphohydrolase